jgi:hypothetical protein
LKGLNGWRIPLVNSATPNLLKQQTSFNSFKKLLAGQYHLWSDVAILEANQINVHKATNPDGIFEMLSKQRLDYFPRSALEIWHEMERYQHLNIAIEQHTLLYYPSAYYYYVNHQSTELAQDIKQGLEAAIKDGSFDKIFYQHFGSTISRVDPSSRKVYRLVNPSLPAGAPLERSELWFDLSKLQ